MCIIRSLDPPEAAPGATAPRGIALERTKSAHDFGTARVGEVILAVSSESANLEIVSLFASGVVLVAAASVFGVSVA